jgi:hypothetical protein
MYTSCRDKVLGVRVFITLLFDRGSLSTVPTYRTVAVCSRKARTSCTRHFNLHGPIPSLVQKSFLVSGIRRILVYHINTSYVLLLTTAAIVSFVNICYTYPAY